MGKLWRMLATGLCFVLYASVAWLASISVLPLVMLLSSTPGKRRRRSRALMGFSFRQLLWLVRLLGVGSVSIEGLHHLRHQKGSLVVANHPMYLDAVLLMAKVPQLGCIVKGSLWKNRFYRRFVEHVGFIANVGGEDFVAQCSNALAQGRTLLMFPEGTRSAADQPLKFLRGAAQVALRSHCQMVPVVIHCTPHVLGKGQRWYHVGTRRWRLEVKVYPPTSLPTLDIADDMPYSLAARYLTRHLEDFFNQRV